MNYDIDESYIKESIRIRNEYFKSLNKIVECEKDIGVYRDSVEDELKQLKDVGDIGGEDGLNDRLVKIQLDIRRTEDIISPHYQNMKKLELEADRLYENIISKYPDIDINDVKKQIIDRL